MDFRNNRYNSFNRFFCLGNHSLRSSYVKASLGSSSYLFNEITMPTKNKCPQCFYEFYKGAFIGIGLAVSIIILLINYKVL